MQNFNVAIFADYVKYSIFSSTAFMTMQKKFNFNLTISILVRTADQENLQAS